jgi:hypothetical protein
MISQRRDAVQAKAHGNSPFRKRKPKKRNSPPAFT